MNVLKDLYLQDHGTPSSSSSAAAPSSSAVTPSTAASSKIDTITNQLDGIIHQIEEISKKVDSGSVLGHPAEAQSLKTALARHTEYLTQTLLALDGIEDMSERERRREQVKRVLTIQVLSTFLLSLTYLLTY